jgi:hypothetical protein
MSNRSMKILGWIAVLAVAQPLKAQEPSIEPGARVRIKASSVFPQPIVGTLESVHDSTLVFRSGQTAPLEIRFSQIERLEVSQGKKSNAGTGALVGGLIGTAVGAVVGLVFAQGTDMPEGLPVMIGAAGAGSGVLLGALVGASDQSDRWVEVPLARKP